MPVFVNIDMPYFCFFGGRFDVPVRDRLSIREFTP